MAVRKKIAKEKASQTTLDPETGEAREAAESVAALVNEAGQVYAIATTERMSGEIS